MTKLVSISDMKDRLSLFDPSLTTMDDKIGFMIEIATARLESLLRTKFLRATRKDRFFFSQHLSEMPVRDRSIPLRLTAGYVVNASVTVKTYPTVQDIDTLGATVTQPYPAEVHLTDGMVRLFLTDAETFIEAVIQVEYQAGFTVDGNGVYEAVPVDLQNLCFAIVQHFQSACGGKKPQSLLQANLPASVMDMVEEHVRFFALSADPVPV